VADAAPVKDCNGLQQMSEFMGGVFELAGDVDCHGVDFRPVGTALDPFTGSFDGGGHRVTGLNIIQTGWNYVGLFGYVYSAKIANVQVSARLNANAFVGVLVGFANASSIANVSVSGNIMSGPYAGGLAGAFASGRISNCNSSVVVTSNGGEAGGLIGSVIGSTVLRCTASGAVTAACLSSYPTSAGALLGRINATESAHSFVIESWASGSVGGNCPYLGGLVGDAANAFNSIQNSYSLANVSTNSGNSGPGGLIGAGTGVFVVFSYAAGSVMGSNYAGGLVSCLGGTAGAVVNSYFNSDTTKDRCGVSGNTTKEMMQKATYLNWDFDQTWGIHETSSYPFLLWL